jgi:hypothetical protein
VTRVAAEWTATLTRCSMATKMRDVGKEVGIGRGCKSNGDGMEDGDGKQ